MKEIKLALMVFLLVATNAMSQEIFNAITADDIEKVKGLLESDSTQLEITQEHGMTPLMFAATEGKFEIAKMLIDKGANVNFLRPMGFSSLKFAASFGHFEIVKLLVENGADVNNTDNFGETALHAAINHGTKEIAEYLVDHGAEIPVGDNLLHLAVSKGMTGIVTYMIENGASLNTFNNSDGSLLHSAAKGNQIEIVNELIDKGADINLRNRYGLTPIHIASMKGNADYVRMLIQQGADISIKTNRGKNPFMLAYENNHQNVLDLLKKAGAEDLILRFMDVADDPYFGLKRPGLTSEIFAPGIISTEIGQHGQIAFSPNMDEIYWQSDGIKFTKRVNGKWTFPDTLEVFQKYQANNPALSSDGNTLFFHSKMSLEKDGTLKDNDLWFVKRTDNGWSEPENLGSNVNTELSETNPSVAKNGNLYFTSKDGIYRSEYINGQYQPREKLRPSLNDGQGNGSPYIAPDESFIIFESIRPGGFSFVNLYICFKDKDGSWSQAIIMGEDICKGNARFPGALSPDGKYFFFVIDLDYYWVDAKIIELVKSSKLQEND